MGGDDSLGSGRDAFEQRAWGDAYAQLMAADAEAPLAPDDLDRLATAAYLLGKENEAVAVWTRAYQELVDRGQFERAARCGFWLSHNLLLSGDLAQSRGWLVRMRQLLDDGQLDCVERGYVHVVEGLYSMGAGDAASSYAASCRAATAADRFGDPDLATIGLLCKGKALAELGEPAEAMGLLDEAIVAVTAREVSPIVTGIVYCAAIQSCRRVADVRRAREWTAALSDWCASQPDLVPFRGQCLVHRSEILQLHGDWRGAVTAAQRACDWLSEPLQPTLALALYQQGELQRLRGAFAAAEESYRQASQQGLEPQPGLALLRLAQGRTDSARAAIRRLADETGADSGTRSTLLGPFVEIMLATGEIGAARVGADELANIAADVGAPVLLAASAQAAGTVLLAEGDAAAALHPLRRAWALWQELDVPYDAARTRAQIGCACRELGDHDTAETHLDAARAVFERLGAAPDVAWVRELRRGGTPGPAGGLTAREREVLALLAAGRTNRQIAGALVISEKTVERHLSNMYTKLEVSSRAAATAHAFRHGLV